MKVVKLGFLAAGLMSASNALAATLSYSLTGDYTASWTMSSRPVPVVRFEPAFRVENVSGIFQDVSSGVADLNFYLSGADYSFVISKPDLDGDFAILLTRGPQLFTGAIDSPTMLTGRFDLFQPAGAPKRYTLIVTEIAAVPEPTTWVMMIAGFGLAGVSLRRQKRSTPALRA